MSIQNRRLRIIYLTGLLVSGLLTPIRATHIVGGHLTMQAVSGKTGYFRLKLIYYFNEQQTQQPRPEIQLVIFRKSDNQAVDTLLLTTDNVVARPPITVTNPRCATTNNLQLGLVSYEKELFLDPNLYTDPQGYYLTHQTCCRNNAITNIRNPGQAGFTFYLEFPAIKSANQYIVNSSPELGIPNGESICAFTPFQFSSAAQDADKDKLVYSLVTPLQGFVTGIPNERIIKSAPYPEIQWNAGYSSNNAIPGTPSLTIDANTGILSVIATKIGLFICTVRVEEYRDGKKIGEVRADYQFLVTECLKTDLPKPVVTASMPIRADSVYVCQTGSVTLSTTNDPALNYQWQLNGLNLAGATTSSISPTVAGQYTITVSKKDVCTAASLSKTMAVALYTHKIRLGKPSRTELCASPTDSIRLGFSPETSLTYTWFYNAQALSTALPATITATEPGLYWVEAVDKSTGCQIRSDSILLEQASPLTVRIDSIAPVCGTDAPMRLLQGEPAGGIFTGDGVSGNQFSPAVAGIGTFQIQYTVTGTSPCRSGTARRMIRVSQPPVVSLPTSLDVKPSETVTLHPLIMVSQAPYRFSWGGASLNTDITQTDLVVDAPKQDTVYSIRVEDSNGCVGTASVLIRSENRIWIPDAFTPNSDGVNDTWVIIGLDAFPDAQLIVYNRWGEVVHSSVGRQPPFNGTFLNTPLPAGAYSYVLKTALNADIRRGSVLIIR